jgi:hypothetical protein
LRAFRRPSLVETEGATGVLATIAFLVVFSLLISDFFLMVTSVSSLVFEDLNSIERFPWSTSHAKRQARQPRQSEFLILMIGHHLIEAAARSNYARARWEIHRG